MQLNIKNFLEVMRKATLNHSINSVQLNFEDDRIKTKMIKDGTSDAIVFLDIPNEVITTEEELSLNFKEPKTFVVPYVKTFAEETVELSIKREKMILQNANKKVDIYFDDPAAISVFTRTPREMDFFIDIDVDGSFRQMYKDLKQVGSRAGNVYFDVKDKVFFIEATDRSNRFSNAMRFDLVTDVDVDDLSMMFDWKNFFNLMEVIGDRDFKMKFTYVESQQKGSFKATNEGSEVYFLMSRQQRTE